MSSQMYPDRFLIDAYSRYIEQSIESAIIPTIIKDIIYKYCNPWWTDLDIPPTKLCQLVPDLLCYYSTSLQTERIILSSNAKDSQIIYAYDVKDGKFKTLCKYPQNFDPICHGQAIDGKNELLYIFYGYNDNFGIFNLVNNEWDIKLCNNNSFNIYNLSHNVRHPASCFIQQPIEQLHIITRKPKAHFYYISDQQLFIQTHSKAFQLQHGNKKMVYVPKIKKLLSIGGLGRGGYGYIHDIYYCDVIQNATTKEIYNYEWKIFDRFKLPFKCGKPQCIVALGAILIAVNVSKWGDGGIWYVDIGDANKTEYKWNKCDIFVKNAKTTKIVITSNNYMHFINLNKEHTTHCKIHLSHLIPHDILMKYLL